MNSFKNVYHDCHEVLNILESKRLVNHETDPQGKITVEHPNLYPAIMQEAVKKN